MFAGEIILSALFDGIVAAVAATGFAFLCNSPRKAVPFSALLAAIGHGLRYYMMNFQGFHIGLSTLTASFCIGLLAMFFAKKLKCPAEVISFPSLLPMIPGMYAYSTILAFAAFAKSDNLDMAIQQELLINIFRNGFTTLSVTMALSVGVILPLLIFYEQSFTMTRLKKLAGKKSRNPNI